MVIVTSPFLGDTSTRASTHTGSTKSRANRLRLLSQTFLHSRSRPAIVSPSMSSNPLSPWGSWRRGSEPGEPCQCWAKCALGAVEPGQCMRSKSQSTPRRATGFHAMSWSVRRRASGRVNLVLARWWVAVRKRNDQSPTRPDGCRNCRTTHRDDSRSMRTGKWGHVGRRSTRVGTKWSDEK